METLTKEQLIEFENEIINEYLTGKIRRPIHLSVGSEEGIIEIFKNVNKNVSKNVL